jgi:hypothetical protein
MKNFVTTVIILTFTAFFPKLVISENYSIIDEMIAASISGDETRFLEVKSSLEKTYKPEKGDRKVARKLNDDALLLLKGNDFQTAAEVLSSAMNADSSDAEIASNLCYALIKAGKPHDAEKPCRKSIMLKPNRAAAWANLAEVYADKGDLKSTIALLDITYLLSTDKNKTKDFLQKYFIDEQKNKILITSANQALQNEGIKPVSESSFTQQKAIASSNEIKSDRNATNKQENTQTGSAEVKQSQSNESSIILIIENKLKSISGINDNTANNIVYGIVIIIVVIFVGVPFIRLVSSIVKANKNKYTASRNVRVSEYAESHSINHNEVSEVIEESTDFNNDKFINKQENQIKQPIEKDIPEDFSFYLKAAETGDAVAQYRLGELYEDGTEKIEPSDEDAVFWYRKAAEQGLAEAQYELGLNYEDGIGVEQDKGIAANWYRKAAEQGLADAQYQLGVCFVEGTGVKQDNKKAAYWFKKAAEQGFADAQYELGICCEKGVGIEKDREMAVYWLTKAAKQGHSEANNSSLIKSNFILNSVFDSNGKFALFSSDRIGRHALFIAVGLLFIIFSLIVSNKGKTGSDKAIEANIANNKGKTGNDKSVVPVVDPYFLKVAPEVIAMGTGRKEWMVMNSSVNPKFFGPFLLLNDIRKENGEYFFFTAQHIENQQGYLGNFIQLNCQTQLTQATMYFLDESTGNYMKIQEETLPITPVSDYHNEAGAIFPFICAGKFDYLIKKGTSSLKTKEEAETVNNKIEHKDSAQTLAETYRYNRLTGPICDAYQKQLDVLANNLGLPENVRLMQVENILKMADKNRCIRY